MIRQKLTKIDARLRRRNVKLRKGSDRLKRMRKKPRERPLKKPLGRRKRQKRGRERLNVGKPRGRPKSRKISVRPKKSAD